ncbi:8752_t:CDS:2 [Funneliformis geosporum]|uniref:2156_t:CDS:1 n=1 Tax=Funneliformis geosporum TaxID=1117311 RepID=A0A9W4SUS1_9GLOM|nr:2156_t:CDS:2 [Funneliformis geosporum]CAI2181836.1 8752_t:CDS:2 [Funneliformis geosporum]
MAALVIRQEGNKFFKEGYWKEAIDKYTKAIYLDPNDHLSYTNRATTYSKMKNYTAAIKDCKESIRIEPEYAKAYYRLANSLKALFYNDESLDAYNTFLKLDPNNILAKNERVQVINNICNEKFASMQGGQIHPALRIVNWANCDIDSWSCKARLLAATREFNKGSEIVRNNDNGLVEITKGIMTDERCITIPSSLDLAINIAIEQRKALPPSLSARAVILRYKQRMIRERLDSILPALATNIRAAFLAGFMDMFASDAKTLDQGIENLQRAVELALFAKEIALDKMDVTDVTFIRSLKVHLMRAILIKYKKNVENFDLFDKVLQLAKEIINNCKENPISDEDMIHYCVYYRGHLKEAYGSIGSAYNARSKSSAGKLGIQTHDLGLLSESIKYYEEAINYLPNDDPDLALFHYLTVSNKLMIGGHTFHEIKQHVQKAQNCEKEVFSIFGDSIGDNLEKSIAIQSLEQLRRPDNIASDEEFFLPQAFHVSSNSEKEEDDYIREYGARIEAKEAARFDLSEAAARANSEITRNAFSWKK